LWFLNFVMYSLLDLLAPGIKSLRGLFCMILCIEKNHCNTYVVSLVELRQAKNNICVPKSSFWIQR